ncbi:hypothetical protein DPMN_139208 [Dreissena polymorpha]|uniref:Uncharacterized protein n=1 Tax=Dreissena polymorpha TaxID=45954 RepID=A0A9D4G932_DREPO|nr:hypothetical protein DPMN_139208 [Dreissena polymorpha]
MLVEQDFSAAAENMLLEQQIAARAASRFCSSSNLLLEQLLNAARAAFFSAAAKVKVSTPLVRHKHYHAVSSMRVPSELLRSNYT